MGASSIVGLFYWKQLREIEEHNKRCQERYQEQTDEEAQDDKDAAQDKLLDNKAADAAARDAGYENAEDAKRQNDAIPTSRFDLYQRKDGKTVIKPKGARVRENLLHRVSLCRVSRDWGYGWGGDECRYSVWRMWP